MTSVLGVAVVVVATGYALWWLFWQPAPMPRVRSKIEGVGWAVHALAACADGVRLVVQAKDGTLVGEFEKRPDTGGVQQDVVLRIREDPWPGDHVEVVGELLREKGFGVTITSSHTHRGGPQRLVAEVPLFGRREEIGFRAIPAMQCVVRGLNLNDDATFQFQLEGGTQDSRLYARLVRDASTRPEGVAKTKKLKEISDAAKDPRLRG